MNRNKNILIVDDDPDFIAGLKMILNNKGYNVKLMDNVKDGKKYLEDNMPDLIILDVMMENFDDGFNMCADIKHDERLKHIPVIILTAVTEVTGLKFDPETDGEYLEADEYMEKPIIPEIFLEKVAALIK